MKNREAYVKRRIIVIGLIFRLGIILSVFLLQDRGFLPDDFEKLLLLLLPISCFYLSLFVRFIYKNKYSLPGQQLNSQYVISGTISLLVLGAAELLLVLSRGLYGKPEGEIFFVLIALAESGFGLYGGFYLSGLFKRYDLEDH